MPNEMVPLRNAHDRQITAPAAISPGECYQLPDGRAAYRDSQAQGAASGDANVKFRDDGQVTVIKSSGVVILDGGRVYWDHSANAATFRTVNDRDFYIGTAVGDAASADTSMTVNLNSNPVYEFDLLPVVSSSQTTWTTAETNGLGVSMLPSGIVKIAFDNATEAAMGAIYSDRTFSIDSNLILEWKVAIYDVGDNAALDINFGAANGTHATDFDSVTERVSFHLDGSDLSIFAGSTDGTTTVAYTDTMINAVDDTYAEYWLDLRNKADVQLYVDGVNVLPSSVFNLNVAAGPIKAIMHIEKTSDDTTAEVRIAFARARIAQY